MRSWARGVLVGLLAAALTVSGCGLNASGGPVVDGDAPRTAVDGNARASWVPPRGPQGVTSETDLMERFFEVAAQPKDALRTRIGEFFTDDARQQWYKQYDQAGVNGDITLVEVSYPAQPKAGSLHLTLVPVGKLSASGYWVDDLQGTPASWDVLIASTNAGPRIASLPSIPGILMARSALDQPKYYIPQTIYFWDKTDKPSQRGLVPDLRYMPSWNSLQSQPSIILNWLLDRPSPAISNVVRPFPPQSILTNSEVTIGANNSIFVDLITNSSDFSGADIAVQVKWSLYRFLNPANPEATPVSVHIQGIATPFVAPLDRFRTANALVGQRENGFAVNRGKVVELAVNGETQKVYSALVNATSHGPVVAAAVTRDTAVGALVVKLNSSTMGLAIGGRIGDTNPDYLATSLTGNKMSRPTFLGRTDRLLVVCDGSLYTVQAGNPQKVDEVTATGLPPLTSVESSPDGKRVVLVTKAGAVLIATVEDNGILVLGVPTTLNTTDYDEGVTKLTAVAAGWVTGTELLVAGHTGSGQRLRRISVDGVKQSNATNSPDLPKISAIYGVAVRPADALNNRFGLTMLVDAAAESRGVLQVFSQNLLPYPDEVKEPATSHDYTAPFFAG